MLIDVWLTLDTQVSYVELLARFDLHIATHFWAKLNRFTLNIYVSSCSSVENLGGTCPSLPFISLVNLNVHFKCVPNQLVRKGCMHSNKDAGRKGSWGRDT